MLCSCCVPASPKPPPPRASFVKEASLAPLCLHMGMFGQSSCLHTTLASIEQQPLIPDDTGRRACVCECLMLPCQPHATQHRAPLRYKHGFDGVEQRSQRLNRVHGKGRARCRLTTHCGHALSGVLPACAKGDALEVVSTRF